MSILIFLIIFYLLLSYSLTLVFPSANIPASRGWIPGVNFGKWCEMIGRSPSYAWWLLFPIVNIFIYAGMAIDMVRSYGQHRFIHSVLAVIGAPIFFIYLSRTKGIKYQGPILEKERAFKEKVKKAEKSGKKYELEKLEKKNPFKKSILREWTESMIFAIFAAAFIRMFLIEAYTIPTPSMEDSLMVGDYLFVSKVHYGMRSPMTVAQIPLLHNRIPILNTESYLEKPSLPYFRLPALTKVKRNDPVVFNWPVGDSVFILPTRTVDVGQAKRSGRYEQYKRRYEFVSRPMDKTDFYIKRCVAIGGDTLEIRNRDLYINGELAPKPEGLVYTYRVKFNGPPIRTQKLREWKISTDDISEMNANGMVVNLTDGQKEKIRSVAPNAEFTPIDLSEIPFPPDHFFPNDAKYYPDWNYDNYGPLYVPKKGATVQLSRENISIYHRIINVYEDNDIEVRGDDIFINGEKTKEYTFQWNYYWMMGDNRHNSEDSRIWGFVPETHIVGKPLFIFFSTVEGSMSNGIRWNRIFKSANIRPED